MKVIFTKYMDFWPAIEIHVKKWNYLYYLWNRGVNWFSYYVMLRILRKPFDLFFIYDEEFIRKWRLKRAGWGGDNGPKD